LPRAAGPLSPCLLTPLHYLMSCLLCLLCWDVLQVQGLMYIFDCEWCNLYIWTSQRGSAGGWVGGWGVGGWCCSLLAPLLLPSAVACLVLNVHPASQTQLRMRACPHPAASPLPPAVYHIRRDRAYWGRLWGVLADFWWSHVVPARQEFAAGRWEEVEQYRWAGQADWVPGALQCLGHNRQYTECSLPACTRVASLCPLSSCPPAPSCPA
jgi:hypothetical protein